MVSRNRLVNTFSGRERVLSVRGVTVFDLQILSCTIPDRDRSGPCMASSRNSRCSLSRYCETGQSLYRSTSRIPQTRSSSFVGAMVPASFRLVRVNALPFQERSRTKCRPLHGAMCALCLQSDCRALLPAASRFDNRDRSHKYSPYYDLAPHRCVLLSAWFVFCEAFVACLLSQ